ncbi:hypothetical protein O0I10_000716 [Lichtheimia ornata]|uniref:Uncharacterized protein n=1 Tax=Lichtheimia ornata TaxID=688661 RepID=A0AAD7Y466_9FUNG|nr:uncharacterized protein O0I10_000716 [Lichtheimia ornata]KAJ8663475.1 hypothetical protein O0I10_000716 [Lichtheimia ornata]
MATSRGTAVNITAYNTTRKRMRDVQLDTGTLVQRCNIFLMHQEHPHDADAVTQVQQIMQDNTRFTDDEWNSNDRHVEEAHRQVGGHIDMFYNTLQRVDPATFNGLGSTFCIRILHAGSWPGSTGCN